MKRKKLLALIGSICLILVLAAMPFMGACAKPAPAPAPAPAPTPAPAPAPAPAPPEVITWKCQTGSSFEAPPGLIPQTHHAFMWAEWLEDISGGRLKVDVLPPGTVCSTLDLFDTAKAGTLDAAVCVYGGLWKGKIGPIAEVEVGPPLAWTSLAAPRDCMHNYGLEDILREAYGEHGLFHFQQIGGDPYLLMTNFPISRISDVEGKKIRAIGTFAKLMEKFGASTTMVPTAEVYMAMKLGTVDGEIYGSNALITESQYEVVKYAVVNPNLSSISLEFIINEKSLQALPDDLENAIRKWSDTITAGSASMDMYASAQKILLRAEEKGVKMVSLPQEDIDAMNAAAIEVLEEMKAENADDPYVPRAVDAIMKQMKDWGKLK